MFARETQQFALTDQEKMIAEVELDDSQISQD